MNAANEATPAPPVVTVTGGHATPEEIAAVAVVFAAIAGTTEAPKENQRRGWSARHRTFTPAAVRGAGWGRG